jgi:large subunit ribosomal protein L25
MKTFELSGVSRADLGKKPTKAVRNNNTIPCVMYGTGSNTHFTVTESDVRKLIYSPEIFEVHLTIDGKKSVAVMKDLQFHPVTDKVLHIDFLAVDNKKPIVFAVPVKIEGLAEGVKAGGKLSLELRKLKISALCKDIPENLAVNVEKLGLGKTLKAGQLSYPNIEILNNKDNVVVAVKLTRAARGLAAKGGK